MLLQLKELFDVVGDRKEFRHEMQASAENLPNFFSVSDGRVSINGAVENKAGIVLLDMTVDCVLAAQCDRCLTEIRPSFQYRFEHVLVTQLNEEGFDDFIVAENGNLDLDELVWSDLVLELPAKFLCMDECRGLCQICGKNLNDGECSCAGQEIDPRLESLKELIN